MKLPKIFLHYASLYAEHGFRLYMIGGTSRDVLLGLTPSDFDFVTEATPEQEKAFLPEASYSFARFGSIKVQEGGVEVDITTLRKEGEYKDHRHPSSLTFIQDLATDSLRRDFTVNALYIDKEGNVYDYHEGLKDLREKTLRFIGDPAARIHEDPLRILRAERFAKRLGFAIEPKSLAAMEALRDELRYLNPEKVKMEARKE